MKLTITVAAALALVGLGTASAAERTVTLAVNNMTCAACPAIVKKALLKVDGVKDVRVSLADRTAVVSFDDAKTASEALTAATTMAGYSSTVAAP